MSEIDEFAVLLFEQAKGFLEKSKGGITNYQRQAYLHAALLIGISALEAHVNAISDEFLTTREDLTVLERSILDEKDFILSKLIFNTILMSVMSITSLLLFQLLLGNPLEHPYQFAGIAVFGGFSLSLVFTFLAAIAARAQQSAALMAILGFPLIIPQLLLLMRISNIAFSDVLQSGLMRIIFLLAGFDVMVVALAIILFPFLWKD